MDLSFPIAAKNPLSALEIGAAGGYNETNIGREGLRMRILRGISALLLAVFLTVVFGAVNTTELLRFRDVAAANPCYEAADWAVAIGLASPTSETEFSPNWTLTRAELAGFFYRYADYPEPKYTCKASLNAGEPGQWYYDPMHWCADWGLLAAEKRADYPGETVTRSEAVVALWHYAENWEHRPMEAEGDRLSAYADLPSDPEAQAAWRWAAARGLIVEAEGASLRPDSPLTRGALVTLLYRYAAYRDGGEGLLRCEILCGLAPRGWQRLLLETAEKALGADWVDEAYELDADGIPTVIDCSGYVNWMFTSSGLHPYDDLDCRPLWDSDVFTRLDERGDRETGEQFYARIKGRLKLGDLLLVHENIYSGYHIMVYIGPAGDGAWVLQSLDYTGVDYFNFPADSYYLKNLYGVLRYNP